MLYDPRRQIYNAVLQTLLNSLLNLRGKQQKFYLGKRKQCQLTVWLPLLVNANKGSLDSGESHWPQKRQSASSTRGRRHHRWDKIRWGKKRNIFSALWCKVKKKKTMIQLGACLSINTWCWVTIPSDVNDSKMMNEKVFAPNLRQSNDMCDKIRVLK